MTRASGTLDERYSEWLYDLVIPSKHAHERHYRRLFERLYVTPFRWFVPNDDNRVEDARELRGHYYQWSAEDPDYAWLDLDASVLEVLIALANRAGFETSEAPGFWFFRFLDHLGISQYHDRRWNAWSEHRVDNLIERFIAREYHANGEGGLFPLKNPRQDQREVELWYQMSAYVLERM